MRLELKNRESCRFTSKELDEETGLYYHGARYYEPTSSRWMSPDPAGFGLINPNRGGYSVIESLNWYSYVSNNPINYTDPTGMWIDNEDGTHTAEDGDTLHGLYGDDWEEESGFGDRDPRSLQIGEIVGEKEEPKGKKPSPVIDKGESSEFIWPAEGKVTSEFGEPRMFQGQEYPHRGIDIANKEGTPIKAAADGKILAIEYQEGGFGYYVKIDHENGKISYYAHLMERPGNIELNQPVKQGDIIGQMGNTGYSSGSHLHFGIRVNGVFVNPRKYLK